MRHAAPGRWLTPTVLALGLASLFSDACYELILPLLPAFLAALGGGALFLGIIEGVSDLLASAFKLWGGALADRVRGRKLLAATGYLVVGLAMPAIGLVNSIGAVLVMRSVAWSARGFRSPLRDTLLVDATTPEGTKRAFGLQRALDNAGSAIGAALAIVLVLIMTVRHAILLAFVPGLIAAAMYFWVRERPRTVPPREALHLTLRALPLPFKRYLAGCTVFGLGNFTPLLLVLVATHSFAPSVGIRAAIAIAAALYLMHNSLNALLAFPASLLAERIGTARLLALGFAIFTIAYAQLAVWSAAPASVVVAFILAAIGIAIIDPMEGAFATELLPAARRGTGFGVLAALNGVGDFASSVGVGFLLQRFGGPIAFGTAAVCCAVGALLLAPFLRPGWPFGTKEEPAAAERRGPPD